MASLGNIGGFNPINTNYSKSPVGQQKQADSTAEIADGFVSSGSSLNEVPSSVGSSATVEIPAEFAPAQTAETGSSRGAIRCSSSMLEREPGLGNLGVITELAPLGFSDAPKGTTLGVHTNGVGSSQFFGLGGRVYG